MAKWALEIAKMLRETNVPQITGRLIDYVPFTNVVGKCALGVISCEVGLPLSITQDLTALPEYQDILKEVGVPNEFLYDCVTPFLFMTGQKDLYDIIYTLNDAHKLTFEQIADYIETTFGDVED